MKQGFKFFVCAAFILGFLTQISPLTAVEAESTSQQSTTPADRGRAALRHLGEALSSGVPASPGAHCSDCVTGCPTVPKDCWNSENNGQLSEFHCILDNYCLSGNYCCTSDCGSIPTCACTSKTGCVCQFDANGNATSCTQT
jgi:hypothetical protein